MENDGWGLKVEGTDDAEVTGEGVVTEGNVSFVPKEAADLTVSVKKQAGCKLNVNAGKTSYTTAQDAGGWTVSFGTVLNNLRVFLSRLAAPAPAPVVEDRSGLDEQYMAFIDDVVSKIKEAPENGTVEIDAGVWCSYRTEVFKALAARPDVALRTTYKGENGLMRFTIPAGTDVLGAVGGRTVIEFAALAALFGLTPVEADMKLAPRG